VDWAAAPGIGASDGEEDKGPPRLIGGPLMRLLGLPEGPRAPTLR
jgi:hypothetical protein